MKIYESGEMYLETIFVLRQTLPHVRAIDIAAATGYSKPSISRALGLLRADGLIEVASNGHITLTAAGEERAHKVYDRHRLLTDLFLSIGVSKETADADACRIEHVISDETAEKIRAYLQKS